MPKFRNIKLTLLLQAVLAAAMAPAQQPVAVGRGSYAAFPPTYKSRTADHGGSWATMMETREIYLDETVTGPDGNRRPIPTNDWWTDLLNHQFANALWSLPQMLKPAAEGVAVHYPTYWIESGTEVKSRTSAAPVMQGFLPHAYKHNVTSDVQFGDLTYLTPRGTMRMAEASFTPTVCCLRRPPCRNLYCGWKTRYETILINLNIKP